MTNIEAQYDTDTVRQDHNDEHSQWRGVADRDAKIKSQSNVVIKLDPISKIQASRCYGPRATQ